MSSIELDISQTLNKLHTLLSFCTSDKADAVYRYIAEAKAVWEEEYTNDNSKEN